jgi:hypothetical protein
MAIFSKLVITAVILVSGLLFVAAALTHNDPLVLSESGQVAQDRDLSSDYVDDYKQCSAIATQPELKTLFELHQHSRERGERCGSIDMPSAPNLQWNCQLVSAAEQHAIDIAKNRFMAHNGSNGSTVGQRATEANYIWRNVAENLAQGIDQAERVHRQWLDSQAHCNNIMSDKYTQMGAAKVDDYWVVVFGRSQSGV